MTIDAAAPMGHRPVCSGLAMLTGLLDELIPAPLWPLSDADLDNALYQCSVQQSRLAALQLSLVREVDGRNLARQADPGSTADHIRTCLRLPPRDAVRLVDLAAAVDGPLAATGRALAEGEVSPAQAMAIRQALRSLPAQTNVEVRLEAEYLLLGHARTFDAGDLARMGRRIRERLRAETGPRRRRRAANSAENNDESGRSRDSSPAAGARGTSDDKPVEDVGERESGDGPECGMPPPDDAPESGTGNADEVRSQRRGSPVATPETGGESGGRGDDAYLTRRAPLTAANRSLRLVDLPGGSTRIVGELDDEAASVVYEALEPLAAPRSAADSRSLPRRRADALVELARRATEAARPPRGRTASRRVPGSAWALFHRGSTSGAAPRASTEHRAASRRRLPVRRHRATGSAEQLPA
ncbi:DUF222 domain-containing protein [Frankia sp. AgKG'84/4]|uniref:DUF222 domain-containing protein n=1 Tax=Frankia sp. AgKG'84/4 TaxID=573490 RepID=UPI0020108AB5|nr:DUF222 domain-containing protein [Frankia sp. AgKG'84/4]MCL9792843.1 13E12 repeat family protein [Frankia sp. AgKG'84/4]